MATLLEEVSDLENLNLAFYQCLRGKRNAVGAQKVFLHWDKLLFTLQKNLQLGEDYPWGHYRKFWVCDPKKRLISSAPFIDRVAHRAIHNVLYPLVDPLFVPSTFACREGKGNGRAVLYLRRLLQKHPQDYIIKLDVKKFFNSINQYILFRKLARTLPDKSLLGLILGLLKSHPDLQNGVGLPLGNLTSQVFANFYLNEIDQRMYELTEGKYIRYMDDILLFASSLREANKLKREFLTLARREQLSFPQRKQAVFAPGTPIPFLGFSVTKDKAIPLNRNKRRIEKKLKRKVRSNFPDYQIYQSILSYKTWREYPNSNLVF